MPKAYKCQLGEFYVDEGCQICQSIYGFYSVTYNATKCSIFDKNKFANISSNAIQLLEGYWRSDYYSDQTDFCFKNIKYCKGGWKVGHELCSIGHLGGLCEECDKQNIRGEGKYFKNQENTQCYNCSTSNVASFIFASLWAMISILITLKSIEKSNELFSSLRFRIRYRKILFKFYQDLEGIFIKMLLNYLWIFSVIFTFNIKFQISFSFVEQTSNTSQFMAFSLDCFLSDISEIELIYVRIIATILLILIQFTIILFGYQIYIVATKGRFQANIISNTLLYLYVSNYSGLIKQFCSIISRRIISNTHYIQGDVTLKFGSLDHYSYILQFAIPGLTFFGCLIPFSLFLIMHLKKDQFNQISLRRHICYLFNEYNEQTYFWKQIKFSKKTIIILVMTYFESNILLKASLLGLCLLVYQLLAVKHQPYIISNLNSLDLQTGQICSIAIFLATVKYVSEQETQEESSKILQLVIMFLCVRLCYPFILNIFRVYVKKYRVEFITLLQTISKYLKIDSQLVNYLSKILIQWRQKENRLKSNYQMLKKYLMAKSKAQIKYLKSNNSVACAQNPLSLNRDKQLQTATANFIITFQK
ncbi:unnamed protein product [Paramecium pentaurelia]|uniref:Transmembrane protein n=1 Tax=Paramecium pentaurelia TaxID=43138 RepID=A0A8S1SXI8_9CILI|nr:unnamed protein product [Paramecium pentaurelia]